MGYNFKKLSEVAVAESVSNSANVLVEDGGEIKRISKSMVGGGSVISGDSSMPVYNKAKLSAGEKIELAKSYTPYVSFYNNGGTIYEMYTISGYRLNYDSSGCCGGTGYSLSGTTAGGNEIGWYVDITEEQFNEIAAAWEAMVGTNV